MGPGSGIFLGLKQPRDQDGANKKSLSKTVRSSGVIKPQTYRHTDRQKPLLLCSIDIAI